MNLDSGISGRTAAGFLLGIAGMITVDTLLIRTMEYDMYLLTSIPRTMLTISVGALIFAAVLSDSDRTRVKEGFKEVFEDAV